MYYLSFETQAEAMEILEKLNSKPAIGLLSSLIFWNEKRPIKTGILNLLDWTRVEMPVVQHIPIIGLVSPVQNAVD